MKTLQASVAKAKFAEVLREVRRGETVAITLHGEVVAEIVPRANSKDDEKVAQAIEGIKKLRKQNKPVSVEEILAWRDEGRP